jgi:hypothetical protein
MPITEFNKVRDNARSTVAVAHVAGSGTLVVASGHGARFEPTGPFWLTAYRGAGESATVLSKLVVGSVSGDTLAITGAHPDYPDVDLPVGTKVAMLVMEDHFEDIHAAINAAESALDGHDLDEIAARAAAAIPLSPAVPDDEGIAPGEVVGYLDPDTGALVFRVRTVAGHLATATLALAFAAIGLDDLTIGDLDTLTLGHLDSLVP